MDTTCIINMLRLKIHGVIATPISGRTYDMEGLQSVKLSSGGHDVVFISHRERIEIVCSTPEGRLLVKVCV